MPVLQKTYTICDYPQLVTNSEAYQVEKAKYCLLLLLESHYFSLTLYLPPGSPGREGGVTEGGEGGEGERKEPAGGSGEQPGLGQTAAGGREEEGEGDGEEGEDAGHSCGR